MKLTDRRLRKKARFSKSLYLSINQAEAHAPSWGILFGNVALVWRKNRPDSIDSIGVRFIRRRNWLALRYSCIFSTGICFMWRHVGLIIDSISRWLLHSTAVGLMVVDVNYTQRWLSHRMFLCAEAK